MIREKYSTVQAILSAADTSEGMVKYAGKIPKESIIKLKVKVTKAEKPITSCTVSNLEVMVLEIWTVNKSAPMLPFQIDDASRIVKDQTAEDAGPAEGGDTGDKKGKMVVVKQDVRLNNRIIDLRVPTNQAIMRLQSGVA